MLLFAASCLVDLARPCWFSRSGEVPDGDAQGKETLVCCRRTQHSGLPLKGHRKSSYSAPKLISVFADDSNTPLSYYWGEDFPGASAPLQRKDPSYIFSCRTISTPLHPVLQNQEAGDGPQPLDTKTSTKHCSVFEVTVHGVLLHFFVVFCVFPFWSLSHPLIFLVYPHAHPQKTRHECSLGSCRAGQGWGLSRVLDQVRYHERSLDGVVSCGWCRFISSF